MHQSKKLLNDIANYKLEANFVEKFGAILEEPLSTNELKFFDKFNYDKLFDSKNICLHVIKFSNTVGKNNCNGLRLLNICFTYHNYKFSFAYKEEDPYEYCSSSYVVRCENKSEKINVYFEHCNINKFDDLNDVFLSDSSINFFAKIESEKKFCNFVKDGKILNLFVYCMSKIFKLRDVKDLFPRNYDNEKYVYLGGKISIEEFANRSFLIMNVPLKVEENNLFNNVKIYRELFKKPLKYCKNIFDVLELYNEKTENILKIKWLETKITSETIFFKKKSYKPNISLKKIHVQCLDRLFIKFVFTSEKHIYNFDYSLTDLNNSDGKFLDECYTINEFIECKDKDGNLVASFNGENRKNLTLPIPLDINFLDKFRATIFREEKNVGFRCDIFYDKFYYSEVWDDFIYCVVMISRVGYLLKKINLNDKFEVEITEENYGETMIEKENNKLKNQNKILQTQIIDLKNILEIMKSDIEKSIEKHDVLPYINTEEILRKQLEISKIQLEISWQQLEISKIHQEISQKQIEISKTQLETSKEQSENEDQINDELSFFCAEYDQL